MNKKILSLILSCGMLFSMVGCKSCKDEDKNIRMSMDEFVYEEAIENQDEYMYQKVLVYGVVDDITDEGYIVVNIQEDGIVEDGCFVILEDEGFYEYGEDVIINGRIIGFLEGVHTVTTDGEEVLEEKVIYPLIEEIF